MSLATPTTGEKGVSADAWSLARKVAGKLQGAEEDDIGSLEVGIIDIFDTVVSLYSGLYPRFAALPSPSVDSVLGELAELRVDLEHIRYHAQLTIEGIDGIARSLRKRASLEAAAGAGTNGQIDEVESALRKQSSPTEGHLRWLHNSEGVPSNPEFYRPISDELGINGPLTSAQLIENIRLSAEHYFPEIPPFALNKAADTTGLKFDHRIHTALQLLRKGSRVVGPEGGPGGKWRLRAVDK